jgi:dihydrofolate reductase
MTSPGAGQIVAGLFITLDGVVEDPSWQLPYFHPEMGADIATQLATADALLLGRRTYEEFAAFWPTDDAAGNPLAERMNAIPKLVAASTLEQPAWRGATVIRGELAAGLHQQNVMANGYRLLAASG